MEAQLMADRLRLPTLLTTQPDWSFSDLADALGRSYSWVKKWVKRLREARPDDDGVLTSRSRARKTPPPAISAAVIERILDIRDHPPFNLNRIPGPKAILYYLQQEATTTLAGHSLPRSTRTIWQILRRYQRIVEPSQRCHQPRERPAPLSHWQLDFKHATSVPAEQEGKQQHVVEVLNTVDEGSSLLLDAHARADFSMASAIEAVAATLQTQGLPDAITIDRDPRFVGSSKQRDCPSAFLRLWYCLGVEVTICPPRRPDLNCFVERYHRSYDEECLQVYRPADLDTVRTVTKAYQQHYNAERPHQGATCHNQPPALAHPDLPPRPPVPAFVDPDSWMQVLDGQQYVGRVQRDTSVSIDSVRYYTSQAVVGKEVTLRLDATARQFVIEDKGQELKRVPIQGAGQEPLPFAMFVEQLCQEARVGRAAVGPVSYQPPLPLA
jgi:hypothetical protein